MKMKKICIENKKAGAWLSGTTVFLIANVVFFGIIFLYVSKFGTGADLLEKTYARQIGLTIDSLRPGTEVNISLDELYGHKNPRFNGEPVIIDTSKNLVTVILDGGSTGHSFYFFTKLNDGSDFIEIKNNILRIRTEA